MALRAKFPHCHQSNIQLTFLKYLPEYELTKPYYLSGNLPEDCENLRTNIQYHQQEQLHVYNIRGQEHGLSLMKDGFQILKLPNDIAYLDVRGDGKKDYIEAVVTTMKRHLNGTYVICYDCRFRSSCPPQRSDSDSPIGTGLNPDIPAEAAHIDHTPESAIKRARRHLSEAEAEMYLNGKWRFRIINVWKPLGRVYNYDLLYCDHSTVQPTDIVAVDRVSSEYAGEVYMLKPKDYYHWYYIDHQEPDEASLFVSFDSLPGSGAPFCPHTSAKRTATEIPRESVELRLLVFSTLGNEHGNEISERFLSGQGQPIE